MRMLRLRRDERGAAVLEFALVFPILMLVLFAIIDFARAWYTVSTLAAAARVGARAGSAMDLSLSCSPLACPADAAAIRAASDTLISRAMLAVPGDSGYDIRFNGQRVTVSIVKYEYKPVTPIALGAWYIDRTAVFRWERAP
jgi:Flp pilus assembly pilin Flp